MYLAKCSAAVLPINIMLHYHGQGHMETSIIQGCEVNPNKKCGGFGASMLGLGVCFCSATC